MPKGSPGRGEKKKSPVVRLRKLPKVQTRIALWVQAGGRCQFDACNRYLLEHHITKTPGNFAQMAHIVAYRPKGSRGDSDLTEEQRNDLSNLMLLCPTCHKLIDDNPETYPVKVLKLYKGAHEDRVFMLTETKPDRRTVGLVLKARIGDSDVEIPFPHMQEAVAPMYLDERELLTIDLTNTPEYGTQSYWEHTSRVIHEGTIRLNERHLASGPLSHISVFALGPIPLLVHLGNCLSNKIPTKFFQRHRDTERWKWKKGKGTSYQCNILRKGAESDCVALLLSLSGQIPLGDIPSNLDERFTIYEISLKDRKPSPRFLETERDLRAFRDFYMQTIRTLVSEHADATEIHLLPAIPAPIGIAVGFDLLPKRDPALIVYDYSRKQQSFVKTIEVNRK